MGLGIFPEPQPANAVIVMIVCLAMICVCMDLIFSRPIYMNFTLVHNWLKIIFMIISFGCYWFWAQLPKICAYFEAEASLPTCVYNIIILYMYIYIYIYNSVYRMFELPLNYFTTIIIYVYLVLWHVGRIWDDRWHVAISCLVHFIITHHFGIFLPLQLEGQCTS